MSCDIARLRLAIDTAREARAEERRFTMRLHGHQVDDPPPEDQSDEEMAESAISLLRLFRGAPTDDDDD